MGNMLLRRQIGVIFEAVLPPLSIIPSVEMYLRATPGCVTYTNTLYQRVNSVQVCIPKVNSLMDQKTSGRPAESTSYA